MTVSAHVIAHWQHKSFHGELFLILILVPSPSGSVTSATRQKNPMTVYIRHKKSGKTSRRRDLTERLDDIEGLLEELLARTGPSTRDTIATTRPPYFRKLLDRAKSLAESRAKHMMKGAAHHGLQETTSADGKPSAIRPAILY